MFRIQNIELGWVLTGFSHPGAMVVVMRIATRRAASLQLLTLFGRDDGMQVPQRRPTSDCRHCENATKMCKSQSEHSNEDAARSGRSL